MSFGIRLIIFVLGLALSVLIFELVRKRKFREELSLMWFIVGMAIMASSVGDLIIDPIAKKLRIGYPPSLVFVWVIFFLLLALLYFSVVISDLKSKVKELSQKIALMDTELADYCKKEREEEA
ncbi:MAG: DUF2304 domain-containing protein [Dissulfurispiraceae bacterium]